MHADDITTHVLSNVVKDVIIYFPSFHSCAPLRVLLRRYFEHPTLVMNTFFKVPWAALGPRKVEIEKLVYS